MPARRIPSFDCRPPAAWTSKGRLSLAFALTLCLAPATVSAQSFVRSDVNGDDTTDLTDALRVLSFLFVGEGRLDCADAADVDDSSVLDISDAVLILDWLFLGSAQPAAPFPDCGLDPSADTLGCESSPCGGTDPQLTHIVIEFEMLPSSEDLAVRGVQPVAYVSRTSIVGSVRAGVDVGSLEGVLTSAPPPIERKISESAREELNEASEVTLLVQAFNDVDAETLESIIERGGAIVSTHRDLPEYVRLARGGDAAFDAIAENSAVASIQPAPAAVLSGDPISFCPGGHTPYGPRMSQLSITGAFAVRGEGWDGTGLGCADLTYYFGPHRTNSIFEFFFRGEVRRAFASWSNAAGLNFEETSTPSLPRSLDIDFEPNDGPLGVLARAFFPSPPNSEPIAGDVRFDLAENWTADNSGIHVYTVALHEIGHSLGLDHSSVPGAIMAPVYAGAMSGLHADDVAGIRSLYALRNQDCTDHQMVWLTGDFDGDGRDDILRQLNRYGGAEVFLSTGNAFVPGVNLRWSGFGHRDAGWYVGDFDGDGRDDLMRELNQYGGGEVFLSTGSAFPPAPNLVWSGSGHRGAGWTLGDFNGDGRTDILRPLNSTGGAEVFLSTGSGFRGSTPLVWTTASFNTRPWYVGDFNGDGLDDVMREVNINGAAEVFFSNGMSFEPAPTLRWFGSGHHGLGWQIGDFDGDGRDDILRQHRAVGGAEVFLSTGQSFVGGAGQRWTLQTNHSLGWTLGDYNGDGRTDIFRQTAPGQGAEVFLSEGASFQLQGIWSNEETCVSSCN